MTSEERRSARYQRRVDARAKNKTEKACLYDNFDNVFSYANLYQSYKMCRKGVAWKASVQKYITQAPLNVWNTWSQLQQGSFESNGFYEFNLMERGKMRHIKSVSIRERVVQRCLCDRALIPAIGRTFIYDNGASMKNKGYSFAVKRLCQHLHEHYRRYGSDGYILLFDFSKFFDRISHKIIKGILRREFTDEKLVKITDYFVDAFGDVGLGLGSQVSQILALASASRLDHYVKEVCRIRGYGRYMDDGYLIHSSKKYLQKCLREIEALCVELEITINRKKTRIAKLKHGFTFLKVRFCLLGSGKVVRKIGRESVVRMRRKLKSLRKAVDLKRMTCDDVFVSMQSWRAYAGKFNAYRTIKSMEKTYNSIFSTDQPAISTTFV